MWFGHTDVQVEGTRVIVASESQFVANWIESNFTADLQAVAADVIGPGSELQLNIAAFSSRNGTTTSNGNSANNGRHVNSVNGVNGLAPSADHTGTLAPARSPMRHPGAKATLRRLDDFVVGASNKLAYSAACRIADDADTNRISPLFIHGDCGVGKTHLLQGVCQRYIERTGRSQHVRYVTGEQFTNEYITAIRANTIDDFRKKIRKLDLLAIDDVHFLSNKVRTQTEFLYTLDAIDLSGSRVVLASDNHPHHIRRFNQALVSRFLSGMVVQVNRPDRTMRVELVNRLAAQRGLRVNGAAVDLIADECLGSVRELEGAITKLAAYKALLDSNGHANGHFSNGNGNGIANNGAALNGTHLTDEIGIVLAEQVFREQAWQSSATIRMGAVIDAVCTRLGVNKADVLGSGRHRRVVLARGLVAYLGRELTTHSFPEIAHSLGRNNHSTIHTADQRLRRQMEANELADLGGNETPMSLKELANQIRRMVLDCRAA